MTRAFLFCPFLYYFGDPSDNGENYPRSFTALPLLQPGGNYRVYGTAIDYDATLIRVAGFEFNFQDRWVSTTSPILLPIRELGVESGVLSQYFREERDHVLIRLSDSEYGNRRLDAIAEIDARKKSFRKFPLGINLYPQLLGNPESLGLEPKLFVNSALITPIDEMYVLTNVIIPATNQRIYNIETFKREIGEDPSAHQLLTKNGAWNDQERVLNIHLLQSGNGEVRTKLVAVTDRRVYYLDTGAGNNPNELWTAAEFN